MKKEMKKMNSFEGVMFVSKLICHDEVAIVVSSTFEKEKNALVRK